MIWYWPNNKISTFHRHPDLTEESRDTTQILHQLAAASAYSFRLFSGHLWRFTFNQAPTSFLPPPRLLPASAPRDPMPCCCQQLGCPVWRKCGIVDRAGDNEISNNSIWIFTAPISSCDPSRINRTLLVNFYNLTDAMYNCKRAGKVLNNSSQP